MNNIPERLTRFALVFLQLARLVVAIVLAQTYVTICSANVVSVANQPELDDALQSVLPGDIVELKGREPYQIIVRGKNFEPAITITSADVEQPATITQIALSESSGFKISNAVLNASILKSNRPRHVFLVQKCKNIALTNSVAIGSATKYLTEAEKNISSGESFALVQLSSGITFDKNLISGYMQGIAALEVINLRINGNEITKLQGDGIRMGGVQNVEIADNRIHDFLGSDQSVNHSDMIQLWSTNAVLVTQNVSILRNRLLSGNGPATESVFMRNEQADRDPTTKDKFYSNIIVTDNLIHNGHSHGITIGEANGVTIANNTLLPNPTSTIGSGANRKMWSPAIHVAKSSTQVVIANNVASNTDAPPDVEVTANYILDREPFKREAVVVRLYNMKTISGAQLDEAYTARSGTRIWEKKLGSSLTFTSP